MAVEEAPITPFFVAGGTVPPGSPSYVERAADRELLEALLVGEYCFVLNSRQMGKSSLAVRTIARLGEAAVRTAFVDLTRIGGATVTPEQWYAGLLLETGRALGLRAEATAWLKSSREVGPAQRLLSFLQEDVLSRAEGPVVLMVDEIDAVRSLSFSTDELFAGLRQLHNGRASDPALARLTVCLLGAALPSDLIRDPRTTPFNVGRRVELRDFTPEEAKPFAGVVGEASLGRVLQWTGGHPFLTQAICAGLPEGGDVDALVRGRYLDARARESDTNLADVGRRILGDGDPGLVDEDRATTLSLYERMLRGKNVADDESNPAAARIKMSGVARVENGNLRIRNRIYAEAFDARWVRENTPGQELRRQRRAFYRGALRTGIVAAAVVAVVSTLAVLAVGNARRATRAEALARSQRDAARYDAYVASMQTMAQREADGDSPGMRRTLESLASDPARGWEWAYWNRAVERRATRLDLNGTRGDYSAAASPASPFVAVAENDDVVIYGAATGRRLRRVGLPHSLGTAWSCSLFRDGRRVLLTNGPGDRLIVVDMAAGRILRRRDFTSPLDAYSYSVDQWDAADDHFALVREPSVSSSAPRLFRLDLDTLRTTPTRVEGVDPHFDVYRLRFDSAGRVFACTWSDARGHFVSIVQAEGLKEIRRFPVAAATSLRAFGPTGSEILVDDGHDLVRLSTTTGKSLGSLPRITSALEADSYAPDGRRLMVSTDKDSEEADLTASPPHLLRAFPGVIAASYLPGDRLLLDARLELMVVDAPGRRAPSEIRLAGGPFRRVGRRSDGRAVLGGASRLVSIAEDRPLAPPSLGDPVPYLDDSGRFALQEADSRCRVRDLEGRRPPFWVPRTAMRGGFAASPDGSHVVVSASPTSLCVYKASDGTPVARLDGLAVPYAARFSDDGRSLAAGDLEGDVFVWDVRTWRPILRARLGKMVVGLAFSGDGARLAAALADGVGVLDLRSGMAAHLARTSHFVNTVAWSRDGRRLASAGEDRKVRLWDPTTGRELGAIGTHDARVVGLWFTPGDRTLCSVDTGGTLKLWTAGERP